MKDCCEGCERWRHIKNDGYGTCKRIGMRAMTRYKTDHCNCYKPKLLPCPFCGGKPDQTYIGIYTQTHIIRCPACKFDVLGETQEHVAAKWNRRDGVKEGEE